jgi:hypothetical protein
MTTFERVTARQRWRIKGKQSYDTYHHSTTAMLKLWVVTVRYITKSNVYYNIY